MNQPNKPEGFVKDAKPVAEPPQIEATAEPIEEAAEQFAEPQPPLDTWPVKVKLMHKPVRNNKGAMVRELSFREPTGGDINRYGNPCFINQTGDVVILDQKMITMMAVLSGILQPFLEAMDPRDYNSCAYRLRVFFIPDPAAW